MQYLKAFGAYLLLLLRALNLQERISVYWTQTMIQIVTLGISSVPIVFIIGIFSGAVTALNTAYQLTSGLFPPSLIGTIVSTSGMMELAPTITSLILAGKIGSNISSELGTMRVTEQIDALDVMGINSASYLILPKILASLFSFPCLIILSAFLIHFGGAIAGQISGEVNFGEFTNGVRLTFDEFHVTFMIVKAFTFGFIISSIASFQGYNVRGGALEVGAASTRTVVFSCIGIVVADYLLAELLL